MVFKQIEEWKEEELQKDLESLEEFAKEYDVFMEENSEIVEKHNYARYHALEDLGLLDKADKKQLTPEDEAKVKEYVDEIKQQYEDHYERLTKFKREHAYYWKIFDKVMYRYYQHRDELDRAIEAATKIFKKDIDKHFDSLQAKVEKKIGKIELIYHIGGDDYRFEGENGSCSVRVILAGGYNIQRLHTRWVIMK